MSNHANSILAMPPPLLFSPDLNKIPRALDTTSIKAASEVRERARRQIDVAESAAGAAVDDLDVDGGAVEVYADGAAADALGVEEGGGDGGDELLVVVDGAAGAEAGVVEGDVAEVLAGGEGG